MSKWSHSRATIPQRRALYARRRARGIYVVTTAAGEIVGTAMLTGRPGVDDYPWDCWHKGSGRTYHCDTLRACVDWIGATERRIQNGGK
jgi:hypothetical protein